MTSKSTKRILNIIGHQKNANEKPQRHHWILTTMAQFEKNDTCHIDEDVKHSELLSIAVKSLKWYNHFGKLAKIALAMFYKVKHICLCYKIAMAWQCHLDERNTKAHFHTNIET